jgi:hypothetical protein
MDIDLFAHNFVREVSPIPQGTETNEFEGISRGLEFELFDERVDSSGYRLVLEVHHTKRSAIVQEVSLWVDRKENNHFQTFFTFDSKHESLQEGSRNRICGFFTDQISDKKLQISDKEETEIEGGGGGSGIPYLVLDINKMDGLSDGLDPTILNGMLRNVTN